MLQYVLLLDFSTTYLISKSSFQIHIDLNALILVNMAEFYHTALHFFNSLSYAIRDLPYQLFVFPSITISFELWGQGERGATGEGCGKEVMPKSLYIFSSNECMFLLGFHMTVDEFVSVGACLGFLNLLYFFLIRMFTIVTMMLSIFE